MFQLTKYEFENLISQIVISRWGGTRKLPYAFTEQGVAMLSSVLRSKRAIQVNIQIMIVFTKVREFLSNNNTLKKEVEKIKKKLNKQNKSIKVVFKILDEIIANQDAPEPKNQIGYKIPNK